ncbi:MAG: Bug family tripartite tricarboxylate transporter substrate binding protein [Lautropia sp.]
MRISRSRRTVLRTAATLSLAALASGRAVAQEFPARQLRLIVPFPPGGGTDVMSRLAAEQWSPKLGQPVVVMNRAGSAGSIASEFVANEPADGYTILVGGQGQMFINQALGKKLSYDPDNGFAFVGMLGAFPNLLVINPDAVKANTLQEFIALAKSQPGGLSYGSNGIGSLSHLTTEVFAAAAGVKFLHVPYQGAAPQLSDLLSGRIGFTVVGPQGILPHVKEGKLRVLAVTSAERYAALPDAPTLVESGFPALAIPVWFAAYVRSTTPAPVIAKLRGTLAEAAATAEYRAGLDKQGAQLMAVPVDSAAQRFAAEKKLWVDAVERTGAKE